MYSKVLVPLDGSEVAECALNHMQTIVRGCNIVDVVLLRVISPTASYRESFATVSDLERVESEERTAARAYLDATVKQLAEVGLNVQADMLSGDAAEAIVDYASDNGVDLIIMATHGRSGVRRWAMGSVADRVVRHASVPVLLARASKDVCVA